ncbi:MAG: hypothetical protein HZB53_14825 [Chloroflexi bacterium]|nr:hypothetical protein [Chloroflexota bacterium]
MKRAKLTEVFHGDGNLDREGIENLSLKGNETLTLKVKGGRMTFLTQTDENDEQAIRAGRFVTGEIELESGLIFSFWLSDEGRGGLKEVAIYKANAPQTG